MLLKVPGGRIYAFYNHNTDRVTEIKREDGGAPFKRVDCLGHYVFKYSDDNGRTWSAQRYDVPVREYGFSDPTQGRRVTLVTGFGSAAVAALAVLLAEGAAHAEAAQTAADSYAANAFMIVHGRRYD